VRLWQDRGVDAGGLAAASPRLSHRVEATVLKPPGAREGEAPAEPLFAVTPMKTVEQSAAADRPPDLQQAAKWNARAEMTGSMWSFASG
jgi:hypothetical protein